jgi:hypothetical protein
LSIVKIRFFSFARHEPLHHRQHSALSPKFTAPRRQLLPGVASLPGDFWPTASAARTLPGDMPLASRQSGPLGPREPVDRARTATRKRDNAR